MKIEEIIEKDKVKEVREDFYAGIIKKMVQNKKDSAGPMIRKRHLGISIAAGIVLGFLVGSIYHYEHWANHHQTMQEWLGKYNINDTKLECIEDRLF